MSAGHAEALTARVIRLALQAPVEWRIGQAMFNALLDIDPALAEQIRGTSDDPFHDNDRATAFIERLHRADQEAGRA